ncbi:MAG: cation:proton antiporter [Nitrospirae bacterium]|nr:cation:proton antiporter [Nitrospirota bacterium]
MERSFLKSLVIIFGVSWMVVFLLGRLKIPSIAGFLIAGVILGPHGFEFIREGDIILLIGKRENINQAIEYLET